MSGAAGTLVGTIFLTVLRAGEPLQVGHIAEALHRVKPELTGNAINNFICEAYQRGYLERSGTHGRYRYRVTPRCTAPPGIRLADIMEHAPWE